MAKLRLLNVWTKSLLIVLAVITSATIAVTSRPNGHPDEFLHLDAFRFFETNNWPPPVGSDLVLYDHDGWSRVYTGELLYWLYGKIGRVIRTSILGQTAYPTYPFYRLFNVVLFALTLSFLLFTRIGRGRLTVLALVLLCIPQVYYIYSYCNSDAWSLSISLFLFAAALRLADREPRAWSTRDLLLLGVLTGLLLAAKSNFVYFSLILPAGLMLQAIIRGFTKSALPRGRGILLGLLLLLLPALAIPAPLKFFYPRTQPDFKASLRRMQDEKAEPPYKPSHPTHPDYGLKQRGYTYAYLLTSPRWFKLALGSFYGGYGWMQFFSPIWVYGLALLGGIFSCLLTLRAWLRHRDRLEPTLRLALYLSPLVIVLNICAMLYFSLNVGFQPQGRYLFSALIPIVLLLAGTVDNEDGKGRRLRTLTFVLFFLLALTNLWLVAFPRLAGNAAS